MALIWLPYGHKAKRGTLTPLTLVESKDSPSERVQAQNQGVQFR